MDPLAHLEAPRAVKVISCSGPKFSLFHVKFFFFFFWKIWQNRMLGSLGGFVPPPPVPPEGIRADFGTEHKCKTGTSGTAKTPMSFTLKHSTIPCPVLEQFIPSNGSNILISSIRSILESVKVISCSFLRWVKHLNRQNECSLFTVSPLNNCSPIGTSSTWRKNTFHVKMNRFIHTLKVNKSKERKLLGPLSFSYFNTLCM